MNSLQVFDQTLMGPTPASLVYARGDGGRPERFGRDQLSAIAAGITELSSGRDFARMPRRETSTTVAAPAKELLPSRAKSPHGLRRHPEGLRRVIGGPSAFRLLPGP
jgi:hypothetical protein